MAGYKLSEGSLQQIMAGAKLQDPIMQVLGSKKINTGASTKDRYRILLSDGKYSIAFAMLTAQAKGKEIERGTVVKLKRYVTSEVTAGHKGQTTVLLLLEVDIVAVGEAPIGCPVPLTDKDKISSSTSDGVSSTTPDGEFSGGHNGLSSAPSLSVNKTPSMKIDIPEGPSAALNQTISDVKLVSPISALTPYHNKWVIKARVANKSDIRTWSNSRGEGKLFSVDIMDDSGEIRCTAFRDLVDKYYNYLQVDKVYYISKCQLKPANRQFNTLKNDYEMTMTAETIVEECTNDDGLVPQVRYEFVPLADVAEKEVGSLIDVIGVCKESGELQTFTSKTTNRELKKREVFLVDQSNAAIALTLWGNQAETFDGSNNPVLVLKGAKVGEFGGGKNLSVLMSSVMKCNPDISECHRIKGWYDMEGRDVEMRNLSERTGSGNFQTPWMNFKEVQNQGLGRSERGDYYQTMATVLLFRSENAIYKACPTGDCNKKVVDLENGMYRCERCNREYPNFKYRLLVSMNIGDWSNNQWVSLFSSEAEKILGKTSQEVGVALENDGDTASTIFQNVNFKQFVFKCRAKMETFNDEARLKTVVVKVDPINYEEHNNYLVSMIQKNISEM